MTATPLTATPITATIEQANASLTAFEALDMATDVSGVKARASDLRRLFSAAGQPVKPGFDIDQCIADAAARLHSINAQQRFDNLAGISTPATIEYIDGVVKAIYEHFAAAGQPVAKGSAFDRLIEKRAARAFVVAGKRQLEWFEALETPLYETRGGNGNTFRPLDNVAEEIRDHFAEAGINLSAGSYFERRIVDALQRAHAVSAAKMLDSLETEEPRSDVQIDGLKTIACAHFKAAGMDTAPGSLAALRIEEAAANAKLMRAAVGALPAVKPDAGPQMDLGF